MVAQEYANNLDSIGKYLPNNWELSCFKDSIIIESINTCQISYYGHDGAYSSNPYQKITPKIVFYDNITVSEKTMKEYYFVIDSLINIIEKYDSKCKDGPKRIGFDPYFRSKFRAWIYYHFKKPRIRKERLNYISNCAVYYDALLQYNEKWSIYPLYTIGGRHISLKSKNWPDMKGTKVECLVQPDYFYNDFIQIENLINKYMKQSKYMTKF